MLFQDTLAKLVNFTLKDDFHAGALKPQIESAYSSKE